MDFIRYTYALCTLYIRRLQRQELGYFEVVGVVFALSLLPSDEVGTAFANEIMSLLPFRLTIAAGSLLISSLITTLSFTPDLWGSSPQQGPTIYK